MTIIMLTAESDKSAAMNLIAAAERDGVPLKIVPIRDTERYPTGDDGGTGDVLLRNQTDPAADELFRRQAIHDVVAGLAHNLNNIMAVSLGTAEQMLDEMPPGHPLHSSAQMNMTATQRAACLTRRLMMYSDMSIMVRDLVDVDEEIGELLACRGSERPEPIRADFHCHPAAAGTDRDAFFETVDILLDNSLLAIAGVENGCVEIRTSVEREGELHATDMVVVEISDNGVGMTADTLQRAKEPFFTTRGLCEGVGLGLSFADGFARASGGSLELSSRVGHGTRVRLKLPVASCARDGVK